MKRRERLEQTMNAIDAANAEDPTKEIVDGEERPAALLYGERMSAWVDTLRPDSPHALRIAARAQHIRRWEISRDDFPQGKAGYHKWRTTLYKFHGEKAAEIMQEAEYEEEVCARVKAILKKKKLKTDPDVQTLEDAAALVFIQHHFVDFTRRNDMTEAKLIDILQKTWAKMSEQGHEAALGLELPEVTAALVKKALA